MTAVEGHPRILILRGGALGDMLVTLPVLQVLRQRWARAYIELLGYPHIARLAVHSGWADAVGGLYDRRMATFFAPRADIAPAQAAYIRSFDLVINYLPDADGTVRRNLEAAGARQVLAASPHVRDRHAVEHFLAPLESLALYPPEGIYPRLRISPAARSDARRWYERQDMGQRPWVMHPGSGSEAKNWPLEMFMRTACRQPGRGLVLLGEAERGQRERWAALEAKVCLLENQPVERLAELLSCATVYLGNDSGVSHLAAAAGAPVVALFGTSSAGLWAPRGPRVTVLQAPGKRMASLPEERVSAELKRVAGFDGESTGEG